MNTSKKYTIIFVVVCFLMILGIGTYRSIPEKKEPEVETVSKETTDTTKQNAQVPSVPVVKDTIIEESKEDIKEKQKKPTQSTSIKKEKTVPTDSNKEEPKSSEPVQNSKPEKKPVEKNPSQPVIKPTTTKPSVTKPTEQKESKPSSSEKEEVQEPVKETYNLKIIGKNEIANTTITINEGETVFEMIKTYTAKEGIEFEAVDTPYGKYIINIAGLKAANYGGGSRNGWVYTVNGKSPPKSADQCLLKSTDQVIWKYLY